DRARSVTEIVRVGRGLQAHRLALGVGDLEARSGVRAVRARAGVDAGQERAVDAVVGVRHLVEQGHRRYRQLGNGEGRVVGDVHRTGVARLAVADVGTADALR